MEDRSMSQELKPGDRVRVTNQNQAKGHQLGDRGTVTQGPTTPTNGVPFYRVLMDKDSTSATVVFNADEIEADV
jgi:hypothetical protein